jgi:hypothetical protein
MKERHQWYKVLFKQGRQNWFLLAEAFITSMYVKFTLSYLPFKIVLKWLGKPGTTAGNCDNQLLLWQVHHAVKRCHQYSFWQTECYTQALTAKIMLQRRKVASTLYKGFYKDAACQYKGHAWLIVNNFIVTGNIPKLHQYTIQSYFS